MPWTTPRELLHAKNIPAATNGFALGLMGFVGFLRLVNRAFFASSWQIQTCSHFFMMWSLATQAVYIAKLLLAPRACLDDYRSAPTNASLTAIPSTICVTLANLLAMDFWWWQNIAIYGIGLSMCAYVVNMVWFVSLIWGHNKPDTYFLPGTAGLSVVASTAVTLSPPAWLMAGSMWGGVLATCILLPSITARVLRDPTAAPGPSAAVLQSTPSFLCSTWYAGLPPDGGIHPAALGIESLSVLTGPILYTIHVVFVLLSAYCVYQRRAAIRDSWFSPGWAAFTFPMESAASAAMHFYLWNPESHFALCWALTHIGLVMFSVPLCNFMFFRHLEDWLQNQQVNAYSDAYKAGLYRSSHGKSSKKEQD